MNEKNKHKRQSAKLDRKLHRRLKFLALKREVSLDDLFDEAVSFFLKQSSPVPMPRANEE